MTSSIPNRQDPAYRSANAARVLGILLAVVAVLVILVTVLAMGTSGGLASYAVLGAVSVLYGAPGIALIVLSGGVRRGAKAHTIATLILAILVAIVLWFGAAIQTISLFSAGLATLTNLIPLLFLIIIALVATLLSAYCVQSLRFPDRVDPQRGFEPLVIATPVERDPTNAL